MGRGNMVERENKGEEGRQEDGYISCKAGKGLITKSDWIFGYL